MTEYRLQLLNTVKALHEAGTVRLSDMDKRRIETETRDLIRRSTQNARTAAKAPEGFEEFLQELQGAENPDAAYQIVLDFLELDDEGEESGDGDLDNGDAPDKGDEEKKTKPSKEEDSSFDKKPDEKDEGDFGGKGDKKLDEKKDKKPDGKGGKPSFDGKPGEKSDKPDFGGKSEEKGGKPDFGSPSGFPEEDADMKVARRRLVRRAKDQEKGRGRGIGDLQEKRKEEGEGGPSPEEMGIEDRDCEGSDPTVSARAAKIKVGITRERNLIAYHADHGPVFRAVPNAAVKADSEALRRLANKIYGIALYKGFGVAASLCNASLLKGAGVDEGIITDAQVEIPPEKDGILADAETDTRDKPEEGDSSLLSGNEVDTREKPPTVSDIKTKMIAARRKRIALAKARRRRGKDILDDAENVTKTLKPSKPSGNTGDDATFNSKKIPGTPRGDVLADEDNDIRTANLNKLYRHRLEKKLVAEKEQFVRKFTRALRVASTRMLLNHEEHPMKAAAVDVLTGENIEFTDGQRFTGMDLGTALELTELIAAEGHDRFMAQMLSRAADLLEKDDKYLADAEEDLKDQAPVPVGDGGQVKASKRSTRNRRSSRIRRDAAEGNFSVTKNGPPVSGPGQVLGGVRDVLSGDTLLGRRIGRIRAGADQHLNQESR